MYSGPASDYPLSGVYLDENTCGWEVDQNILWNNQYYNIFLHGSSNPAVPLYANNNNVHNNSVIDVSPRSYIWLSDIADCGSTKIADNFVLSPVVQSQAGCTATNNNAATPGANEMTPVIQVGCNFAGCSSSGPPIVSGELVAASIATQPYDMTVFAGQIATFSVTAAGSGPLSYQWQKNGVSINGATGATYTTPATVPGDNGAVFSVEVRNSLGSIKSNPASLTVR